MSQSKKTLYPVATKKGPYTVQVPNAEQKEGHGVPRRHPLSIDQLATTPDPDVKTLYDVVTRGARLFGDAECMGSRKLIKTHVEEKMVKKMVDGEEREVPKKWFFYEMSGYTFKSFKQYKEQVDVCGAGLRQLGLVAGDRVHIYAATSSEWLTMSHGCASQSMPIVTAYDTLGESGLMHSLVQTGAKAIFLNPHLLKNLISPLKEGTKIQYVIYTTEEPPNQKDLDTLKETHPHLKIVTWDELLEMGKANPVDPVLPDSEDLCCIMYTSGSTGTPKGVPLLHRNVIAAIAGVTTIVGPHIGVGDFVLNFLPLAHILELVFENAIIVWGAAMGYGSPRTLADRAMRNCKGDIQELRPTVLVAVPAVWETVKKGIMDQVSKLSGLKQKMFWGAITLKSTLLQLGLPGVGVIDNVVFKKVKEATGGRMRVCMNGGGPIARETHHFISMAICPMIMGYGLTETAAMCCLMDPLEWDNTSLGGLTSSVEVKLVDFADAGYFTSNTPEQGEVWIRGDSVAPGYYENEEETQAAYEDGWFKTGDIGEWDANGHLRLIDRKKNLVKTLNGEYIALEKLESVYRSTPVVQNILVYADEKQTKPVAVIMPNENNLKNLAKAHKIPGDTLEELVHNQKLTALVLQALLAQGQKGGLRGMELLHGVVMTDEEWTPQNGLVTSAQKLNRRGIVKAHEKEIERAYASTSQ
ncbi:hypothetical protein FN846DRAFT_977227 [Sphaerosporella brunnea]|uniref:AMP-dependent synthetase/ligase domain-containing protein n=1 Tax=Sphaerosporella brunnea TaxID=1250544 RepID=A0A5J5EDV1_9PEZI|nr:hypothetical protein FN846DRAFT_977227 [Sphaerosporella brunnea]